MVDKSVIIDGVVYVPEKKSLFEILLETFGLNSLCEDGIVVKQSKKK